jgi:motility quorum-sensing regulator / GCU-specific mRNA interferase toxin
VDTPLWCSLCRVEKRPTYDLVAFKSAFSTPDGLNVTWTALETAAELGFLPADIVAIIQTMERNQFYKSTTSHGDHRIWQDVYHVPSPAGLLYVKFTSDALTQFRLLSFKEKENG